MKKFLAVITLIALLVPSAAFAEGFGVYEWSATGTAMGDNFMFDDEDAAVLAYNPAGMTNLKGKNLSATATWFNPAIKCHFNNGPLNQYRGFAPQSHKNNSYDPVWAGSIFYTQQLSDKHWLGLGVFPRFGNGISYDPTWEGRYDTISAKITSLSIQPTWAFKPHEKWSVALGLDINYMKLALDKAMPLGLDADATFGIDGKCTHLGWLVSAMYDFDKKTSAALTYRSRISHTMDADAYVNAMGTSQTPQAHGEVTVPDSISFGVGHKFNDRARIEFDATWTNWATYDKLTMSLSPAVITPSGTMTGFESEKNWNAVWRFGIGYKQRMNDKWTFLCGYNFDASPVPDSSFDFTVPTGNRHRGSVGLKYNITKDAAVTFAYTAIWAASRNVNSHLDAVNPNLANADFSSARINDCLTQILSLGFTMKLK